MTLQNIQLCHKCVINVLLLIKTLKKIGQLIGKETKDFSIVAMTKNIQLIRKEDFLKKNYDITNYKFPFLILTILLS